MTLSLWCSCRLKPPTYICAATLWRFTLFSIIALRIWTFARSRAMDIFACLCVCVYVCSGQRLISVSSGPQSVSTSLTTPMNQEVIVFLLVCNLCQSLKWAHSKLRRTPHNNCVTQPRPVFNFIIINKGINLLVNDS